MELVEFFALKWAELKIHPDGMTDFYTRDWIEARNNFFYSETTLRDSSRSLEINTKCFELLSPLEDTTPFLDQNLWTKFAVEHPTETQIAKLAKRYGYLYSYMNGGFSVNSNYAERFSDWKNEMKFLFLAQSIWQALIDRDIDLAKTLIPRREDSNFAFIQHAFRLYFGTSKKLDYNLLLEREIANFSFDQLWWELCTLVEAKMNKVELGFAGGHSTGPWLQKTTDFVLRPPHLASALWTQLAQAIASGAIYSKCKNSLCGRLFATGVKKADADQSVKRSKKSHSDGMYCGKPCTQQAYRNRLKAKAEQKQRDQP